MIEAGDLKPTEKLPSETELARVFGVSRPIVREALGSLRAIGLIVSQTGRGSFVARSKALPILLQGRYSLEELFEVRQLLEVDGAALAAERRTPEDLEKLRAVEESLWNCSDIEQWVVLDAAFHRLIGDATGSPLRAHLVEDIQDLLIEQARVMLTVAGRQERANREHRAIYNTIEAGDARAAREAMSVHLRNAYMEILETPVGGDKSWPSP